MALERARLEHTNTVIMAHPAALCEGQEACPLHNRSIHPMRAMAQLWRSDRKIIERTCEHGIGHPDPDQWWYWLEALGEGGAKAQMQHGCDGCCGWQS